MSSFYTMEITLSHEAIRIAAQEYVRKEFPDREIDKITYNGDGTIKYILIPKPPRYESAK